MAAGETTYTALKGTMQSSTTPLTPFYSSTDGTFWTSDEARTTETFGYTYQDTSPHQGDNDVIRQILVKKINAMYGASSPAGIRAKSRQDATNTKKVWQRWSRKDITRRFQPNIKLAADVPPVESVVQYDHYNEWVANVQVNVEALDGRFNVHLFIGLPPSDPTKWDSAPNQIGSVAFFAMNRATGSQSRISGALPLTTTLMKVVAIGRLSDLSETDVLPFIQQHLSMRVQSSEDMNVDPHEVEGLQIDISSTRVRLPADESELPEWGQPVTRMRLWE